MGTFLKSVVGGPLCCHLLYRVMAFLFGELASSVGVAFLLGIMALSVVFGVILTLEKHTSIQQVLGGMSK